MEDTLPFAFVEYKFMELQCEWNSRQFGVKSLLHRNWCVYIQKNGNGRVGGERRSTSLLLMELTYLLKKIKEKNTQKQLGETEIWLNAMF